MRRPWLIGLVGLCACSQHNPAFLGGTQDLSVSGHDLAMTLPDAGARDLAFADLTPPIAVPDLASGSDLSTPVSACSDMLCNGCCVGGVCRLVGEACAAGTVCVPGGTCTACGGLSQPCCSLNFCAGALTCNGGVCSSCGTPGGACCAGKTCAGGGCCAGALCVSSGKSCGPHQICLDTVCTACGAGGAACCQDNSCDTDGACCNTANRTCVANLGACGGGGTCNGGSCNGEGGLGESCFMTPTQTQNLCSASDSVCDDSTGIGTSGGCETCGGDGQPCCGVATCAAGGCCVDGTCHANGTSCGTAGGNCSLGSCNSSTCGGFGQPCCNGTLCTAPDTRCIIPTGGATGTCQPCGGREQRCCVDPQSAMNIFCEPPYACTVVVVGGQNIGFCKK